MDAFDDFANQPCHEHNYRGGFNGVELNQKKYFVRRTFFRHFEISILRRFEISIKGRIQFLTCPRRQGHRVSLFQIIELNVLECRDRIMRIAELQAGVARSCEEREVQVVGGDRVPSAVPFFPRYVPWASLCSADDLVLES